MLQPEVIYVKPLANYRLLLQYQTGEKKIFDVSPYIKGSWFGKLKDVDYFNTVHIGGHTVEWAGGQDIAPHELYELSVPIVKRFLPDDVATPDDLDAIQTTKKEFAQGETINHDHIDWN